MNLNLLNIENRKVLDTNYSYADSGRGWINYGVDNLFPSHIANIVSKSSTQSSIIQTKLKLTIGEGITNDRYANPKENLSDVIKKLTLDYLMFGGFALRVVYTGDKISKIYHTDFTKVRAGNFNCFNEIEKFYLKADWRNVRANSKNNNLIEIPAFGTCKDIPTRETIGELYYFTTYHPDNDYYAKPDWYGAKDEVIMDYELSNYLAAILSNGHFPKQVIFVNEDFTPQEEMDFHLLIAQNFKGTNKAGEPMLITGLKREDSVVIKELDYKIIDPQFKEAVLLVTSKIIEANRIPRVIAGLEASTGFSNNAEELRTAFELFNNLVIKNYQKDIKEALSPIVESFEFIVSDMISAQMSGTELMTILTKDELRAKFGYEPIAEEFFTSNN